VSLPLTNLAEEKAHYMREHLQKIENLPTENRSIQGGNPQEIPTQAEVGWLAGIIEGEGSIAMNARTKKWKGSRGCVVDLQVYAVNTDMGIIEKCARILRKFGVEPHICERSGNPIPRRDRDGAYHCAKTISVIQVSRMADILRVLAWIEPHLAGDKAARARLIREFITRRMGRRAGTACLPAGTACPSADTARSGSWMGPDEWQIVKDFYALRGATVRPEVREFLNEHTCAPSRPRPACLSADRAGTGGGGLR
jgi:hypothetical protein